MRFSTIRIPKEAAEVALRQELAAILFVSGIAVKSTGPDRKLLKLSKTDGYLKRFK
jgi:hypothetical protein